MRINNIEFEDKTRGWRLERLSLGKLTLLVGASGVGKTQILKAIIQLKEISEGKPKNGIQWRLDFNTIEGKNYIWEGEFEAKTQKILFEKLWLDGVQIVDRTSEKIVFQGKETVKLSNAESIIKLLQAESLIEAAYMAFSKILLKNYSKFNIYYETSMIVEYPSRHDNSIQKMTSIYNTLEKVQESNVSLNIKLFLLQQINKRVFDTIKQRFMAIFPQVTDLRVEQKTEKGFQETYFTYNILLKEDYVNDWISENDISSGMYRTLLQLAELYLCPEGTLFLIDEFENSLGINCISELTSDILKSKRQLQFILTSHHPYIINNIPFNTWKLVTRKGGIVTANDASEFNLGKSRHDAFMQLTQLEAYQTGIMQP
jgi:predicted ATPase